MSSSSSRTVGAICGGERESSLFASGVVCSSCSCSFRLHVEQGEDYLLLRSRGERGESEEEYRHTDEFVSVASRSLVFQYS
jgi:hypothetical protein